METFRALNPLEPLFTAIAERIGFPVDQVSTEQIHDHTSWLILHTSLAEPDPYAGGSARLTSYWQFESIIDGGIYIKILLIGLINYAQTCKSSLILKSNFKRSYKKILSTSGPLHCVIVPELPSCLHSASPSPSLPHSTHCSLCLLAGPGALLWLQLFRCADADPVWDHRSLLSHVDLPPSNTRTEVS